MNQNPIEEPVLFNLFSYDLRKALIEEGFLAAKSDYLIREVVAAVRLTIAKYSLYLPTHVKLVCLNRKYEDLLRFRYCHADNLGVVIYSRHLHHISAEPDSFHLSSAFMAKIKELKDLPCWHSKVETIEYQFMHVATSAERRKHFEQLSDLVQSIFAKHRKSFKMNADKMTKAKKSSRYFVSFYKWLANSKNSHPIFVRDSRSPRIIAFRDPNHELAQLFGCPVFCLSQVRPLLWRARQNLTKNQQD